MTKTIDATPSWSALVAVMLEIAVRNPRSADIREEFQRMAEAADQWNAHCRRVAEAENITLDQLREELAELAS